MHLRLPRRTQGLLLGLVTLLVGPIIATTAAMFVAPKPVAETTLSGSVMDRAGRSFLSVGHVVAVRAADPSPGVIQVPPLPSPVTALIAPAPAAAIATPAPAPAPTPATPAPTQRPAAVSAPAGTVSQIILAAAAAHGVDGQWMIRIARCESGLNTRAYNPAGPWIGLFQFAPSTFRGHGGTDIYSAQQQASIAASMLAAGQAHQWPVCSRS